MGVGRRHQHVFDGDAGSLMGQLLDLPPELLGNNRVVDYDDRQSRLAVVQDEATGLQFIVNVFRSAVMERAGQGNSQPRRDIAGGGSSLELPGLLRGKESVRLNPASDRQSQARQEETLPQRSATPVCP